MAAQGGLADEGADLRVPAQQSHACLSMQHCNVHKRLVITPIHPGRLPGHCGLLPWHPALCLLQVNTTYLSFKHSKVSAIIQSRASLDFQSSVWQESSSHMLLTHLSRCIPSEDSGWSLPGLAAFAPLPWSPFAAPHLPWQPGPGSWRSDRLLLRKGSPQKGTDREQSPAPP